MITRPLLYALTAALTLTACGAEPATSSITTRGVTVEVTGYVHAGPVCPVAQDPPDPGCEDRPVEGAVLAVTDTDGVLVTEAVTDATGQFSLTLEPGEYVLVPQPVEGLLGTAEPQELSVVVGAEIALDVAYDTGIR
ncbi:MAG: carboxypeptidase-like regulatory domain-containing protein [Acidimicrobiia bacterium]|nr:carboxypeptidase-like regulatory domain-containing protein [Acidimicrobiia bacterium]